MPTSDMPADESKKWYQNKWVVAALILFFPLIGIPLFLFGGAFSRKTRLTIVGGFVLLLILFIGLIMVVDPSPPESSQTRTNPSPETRQRRQADEPENSELARQLTVIEYGSENPQMADRFDSLLDALSGKYPESRQQVSDMTARAYQMINDGGSDASPLAIMEGMNAPSRESVGGRQYSDLLSVYMVYRIENGQSHEEAMSNTEIISDTF